MVENGIELVGVEAFLGKVQISPQVALGANVTALRDATLVGEAIAKEHVKRVTGQAFASITSNVTVRGNSSGIVATGLVGTKIPYGPDLNYGEPVGFQRNYRRGRRLPGGGRTRPYVAISKGRRAQPFIDPTLIEGPSIEAIERPFIVAADKIVNELAR